MWRNDVLKVLLIIFLGLLGYQLFIGGCDFAGKLAVNTINSIFVEPQDAKSLQQSAIDSAKGAGR